MPLHPAQTLSEQLAEYISRQIIHGELAPGERLPEAELSRKLNVSTNSLREAFRLVERRHLVDVLPRRGVRVRPVNDVQVTELYDFLFLLLGQLTSRAALTWKEGDLDGLMALVVQMEEQRQQKNVVACHEIAFEFIRLGLKFAGNSYLEDAIEDLLPQFERYSYIALKEETSELDATVESIQRLVAQVVARQPEDAAQAIREYGDNQRRLVLRALAKRSAA